MIEGEIFNSDSIKTMEEMQISENDVIVLELRETNASWCFYNIDMPIEDKCEGCYKTKVLKFLCPCKKVIFLIKKI